MKHKPIPLSELKEMRKPLRRVNREHYEKLNTLERAAVFVTEHIGSMGFFLLIVSWTIIWISWNVFAPASIRFDPYPAFVLWLFISNMIQILLMPLIMIGQNLQGKHAEARAEADFEVNVKAEKEIETILQHLENQNDMIFQILEKIRQEK